MSWTFRSSTMLKMTSPGRPSSFAQENCETGGVGSGDGGGDGGVGGGDGGVGGGLRSGTIRPNSTTTSVSWPLNESADGPICGGGDGGGAIGGGGAGARATSTFLVASHSTSPGSALVTKSMRGSLLNSDGRTSPASSRASSNFQYATRSSKSRCHGTGAVS